LIDYIVNICTESG